MIARSPLLLLCALVLAAGCSCHRPPGTALDDSAAAADDDDTTTSPPDDDDSTAPPPDDDDDAAVELYGCAWNADDLDNLPLGTAVGRRVIYRFRAHHSGAVEGDLTVRLRLVGGAELASVTVPAASVGAAVDWVEVDLGGTHTLSAGTTHALELVAPQGTTYTVPPLQDGIFYGLDCDNLFADGHFQARTDGSWGMIDDRTDFEMQFYFPVQSDR